jgi:hypothetical protein
MIEKHCASELLLRHAISRPWSGVSGSKNDVGVSERLRRCWWLRFNKHEHSIADNDVSDVFGNLGMQK